MNYINGMNGRDVRMKWGSNEHTLRTIFRCVNVRGNVHVCSLLYLNVYAYTCAFAILPNRLENSLSHSHSQTHKIGRAQNEWKRKKWKKRKKSVCVDVKPLPSACAWRTLMPFLKRCRVSSDTRTLQTNPSPNLVSEAFHVWNFTFFSVPIWRHSLRKHTSQQTHPNGVSGRNNIDAISPRRRQSTAATSTVC